MKRMDLALVDLTIIWLSVGGCIALFFPVSTVAGALMLPYLAWCTLAWALNYSVWQLNMCVACAVCQLLITHRVFLAHRKKSE